MSDLMTPFWVNSWINQVIGTFLATGELDRWQGLLPHLTEEQRRRARRSLRRALIEEVRLQVGDAPVPPELERRDPREFVTLRTDSLVRGLLPAQQQDLVLAEIAERTVFVTSANIGQLLRDCPIGLLGPIADLYLRSVDGSPLRHTGLLGLCTPSTCYVSTSYFARSGPFEDTVVHEAAHYLHYRPTLWLRPGRPLERRGVIPLQDHQREPFAYACEAYSRLRRRARSRPDREREAIWLACEWGDSYLRWMPELHAVIDEACRAEDGWSVIRARCLGL